MRVLRLLSTRTLLRLLRPAVVLGAGAALVPCAGDDPGRPSSPAGDAGDRGTIVRAVDGDTLLVRTGRGRERVRLLGVDTPETVRPDAPVERCGPEASANASRWVDGHRVVRLVRDGAAPDRDRFGRLLRYVRPVDGGRDLSAVQVAAGLSRVRTYGQDLSELPALRAAESRARAARRGLWGDDCRST